MRNQSASILNLFITVTFVCERVCYATKIRLLDVSRRKVSPSYQSARRAFFVKKELRPETEVRSSGNWRGYIATFSINEDYLVVSDITIAKRDPNKEHSYLRESVFLKTFPNESDRKMDWFTGLLVVPLGKRTRYVHLSYASQYENYLLIRIKDGLVLESDEMDLEEYMAFKVRQFEAFKATPAYEARYKVLSRISDRADGFDLEGFIFKMGGFTQNIDIPFKSPNKSSN